MKHGRVTLGCLWIAACLLLALRSHPADARTTRPIVYVAPIEGTIDLGLAPFVERVVNEAAQAKAEFVILEINTFGGRVDAAVAIRDILLRARVPTVAFVNKRAISAGALISLASNQIAMAEGATIGAAMPVQMGEPGIASPQSDAAAIASNLEEGQIGVTVTMLRPSGIAEINEQRVDVVAEGEYIPAGTAIRVYRIEGHRIVVHRVPA